jgi:WS/DGAT/MGAT family acyltransferase
VLGNLIESVRAQFDTTRELTQPLRELLKSIIERDSDLKSPMQAPACVLNRRIGRNRRFATQQYELDRLRRVAHASGGTLNDVVIALCSGGLRRFLDEMGELPDDPLVAFVPVNIRPKDDPGGGNAIGAILVSMATDLDSPRERMAAIIASTTRAKEQFKGMSQTAIMEYSALLMSPYLWQLAAALAGNVVKLPVTFNLCISNVPGPEEPLYLSGARLDATYPVSIPAHAMALNITVQSYAGMIDFGFIGCRDTLPHLQNLAVYTGAALTELERAYGLAAETRRPAKLATKPKTVRTAKATATPPRTKSAKPAKAKLSP